jgi:hypothetical protein
VLVEDPKTLRIDDACALPTLCVGNIEKDADEHRHQ